MGWSSTEWLVTDPSDRDALDYSAGATGVEETKAFVEGTDLSERTLLVHQHTFEECTSVQVERLEWKESRDSSDGAFDFGVEYALSERGENCEQDRSKDAITSVTRVPATVQEIGNFRWGTVAIGQNDCRVH